MILQTCMYGGLANNFFQIANCIYFLQTFNIPIIPENYKIIEKYEKRYDQKINSKQNKDFIFRELKDFFVPSYDKTGFEKVYFKNKDSLVYSLDKNYIITGFINVRPKSIYDFFNIKEKQLFLKNKYNFDSKNISLIQIRRGDFKNYKKGKYFLSDSSIINRVVNEIKNGKVIWIQTNDIPYCKNLLKEYKDIHYFDELNLNVDEELILGSTSSKIIPNPGSSWGYLLNYFRKWFMKNENNS